jgi:hypothetical protein
MNRYQLLQSLANNEITDANVGYSTVMRMLRTNHKDLVKPFMMCFKKAYDNAWLEGLDNPAELALMEALKRIGVEEIEVV